MVPLTKGLPIHPTDLTTKLPRRHSRNRLVVFESNRLGVGVSICLTRLTNFALSTFKLNGVKTRRF